MNRINLKDVHNQAKSSIASVITFIIEDNHKVSIDLIKSNVILKYYSVELIDIVISQMVADSIISKNEEDNSYSLITNLIPVMKGKNGDIIWSVSADSDGTFVLRISNGIISVSSEVNSIYSLLEDNKKAIKTNIENFKADAIEK